MPRTSHSYGSVSTSGYYGQVSGSYNGYETTYVTESVTYECQVVVEVNQTETIVTAQFEGNIGGCQPYATALKKHYESLPPA